MVTFIEYFHVVIYTASMNVKLYYTIILRLHNMPVAKASTCTISGTLHHANKRASDVKVAKVVAR